ncbi:MAG: competence/damage-inducible protein A [Syntrophomonadaceae bacterium]|nr:competence/damage-inducible protein A [Syntrophomonadaceae bacterium]
MYKAYIISTGTELMLGSTMDSNSVFLSEQLAAAGIKVIGKSTVGDSAEYIRAAFENGVNMADIVISSGGMGPTSDDLTKEVACAVMGSEMIVFDEEVKRLEDFFRRRKRSMPECNLKQAMFPREAKILKNSRGTAPGMYLKKDGKVVILLPGPPREMQNMFSNEVEPLLKQDFPAVNQAARKTIKVLGPGESQVEEMLGELMHAVDGYSLALLAQDGEVHIKITAEGKELLDSQEILAGVLKQIEEKMGKGIFGYDDDSLEAMVGDLISRQGKTLALAESCTAGLLAKMITDIPGSSRYFWGAVASYSNDAKMKLLGVRDATLREFGAVSSETAAEMVRGIIEKSGVELGLAITGIAGPDGGSEEKPAGLVYIALADAGSCWVKEMRFVGGRDAVRILAAKTALDLLRRYLLYGGLQ